MKSPSPGRLRHQRQGQKPLQVEVRQPEPNGLESIANLVRPLLSPLTTTALAILFLMFILLQREDIRDRSSAWPELPTCSEAQQLSTMPPHD